MVGSRIAKALLAKHSRRYLGRVDTLLMGNGNAEECGPEGVMPAIQMKQIKALVAAANAENNMKFFF
jgi:hypothetical protein